MGFTVKLHMNVYFSADAMVIADLEMKVIIGWLKVPPCLGWGAAGIR
jgi:hypothetical protein